MSSILTLFLTRASITRSNTFKACSSNLIPLYDPHSMASPFLLYTLTIELLLQSSGILPSLTTALHMSVIHRTPNLSGLFQHFRYQPRRARCLSTIHFSYGCTHLLLRKLLPFTTHCIHCAQTT